MKPILRAVSDDLLHLDLLRFLASAGIVFHHSHQFFHPIADRPALAAQTANMAQFVDLFFVISGYVIAHVYAGKIVDFAGYANFIKRRIARLVPLHWITLALSVLVWAAISQRGISTNHAPSFATSCIAATAFLIDLPAHCGPYRFNSPSWSIAAEMAMYLAFPIFSFVALRSRLAPVVIALMTGSALLVAVGLRFWPEWVEMPPILQALPSFLLGVGLWSARDLIAKISKPAIWLPLAFTLLVGLMVSHVHVVFVLLAAYLVTILAIAADLQGRVHRAVAKCAPLGQLTYSIYMWHMLFVIVLLNGIGDKMFGLSGWPMIALAAFSYTALFVWSFVSFQFIETPLRRWIDGLGSSRAKPLIQPNVEQA